jgi:hypothetical protein
MMINSAWVLLMFAQDLSDVLPKPEEDRFLSIPWQPNLMKARLDSQQAGKPMLIWVMDGNVLGCT